VFLAAIFRKMPAALSLTSALKADNYSNSSALDYLVIFNAMVPVGAVLAFVAPLDIPAWLLGAMLCFSAGVHPRGRQRPVAGHSSAARRQANS